MDFGYVWPALRSGKKVRLEGWDGYWAWENGTIMMHCADGRVIDIRETEGAYTGAITYGGRDVPYTYTVRDQAQEG